MNSSKPRMSKQLNESQLRTTRAKSSFRKTQRQIEISIENNHLVQKITGIYNRRTKDVNGLNNNRVYIIVIKNIQVNLIIDLIETCRRVFIVIIREYFRRYYIRTSINNLDYLPYLKNNTTLII